MTFSQINHIFENKQNYFQKLQVVALGVFLGTYRIAPEHRAILI